MCNDLVAVTRFTVRPSFSVALFRVLLRAVSRLRCLLGHCTASRCTAQKGLDGRHVCCFGHEDLCYSRLGFVGDHWQNCCPDLCCLCWVPERRGFRQLIE